MVFFWNATLPGSRAVAHSSLVALAIGLGVLVLGFTPSSEAAPSIGTCQRVELAQAIATEPPPISLAVDVAKPLGLKFDPILNLEPSSGAMPSFESLGFLLKAITFVMTLFKMSYFHKAR